MAVVPGSGGSQNYDGHDDDIYDSDSLDERCNADAIAKEGVRYAKIIT